jgi:uncharacterized protein YbbC (DUF1343 family)
MNLSSVLKHSIIISFIFSMVMSFHVSAQQKNDIIVGAEQTKHYLPLLINKRVGLVVNQTSIVFNTHLVDALLTNNIDIKAIFSPEHGFRGDYDAGEKFDSTVDSKTGIPLVSLYGKHRKPSVNSLKNIDVLVFDIQDVGVRYYTYISTLHYIMKAAAENGIKFIILDRPNPNGRFVDGPILETAFRSFVGMHPIPLLHGMTVGELAKMILGEGWLNTDNKLDLTIVKLRNYQRDMRYVLPVKPSPNLPNEQSVALYASLGFFEATPVSIGRGTKHPFQVIGHDKYHLGDFKFMPVSMPGAASQPKLENKSLTGQDLRLIEGRGLNLNYLINWYEIFSSHKSVFFTSPNFMDKLAGTDKLRKAVISGQSEEKIRQSWQHGLQKFRVKRKPYLLYPDLK